MNRALLAWFDGHGRDLAFRRTREPYPVLVSEVMLQQTQAARVEPVWAAFMERFPTVTTLAAAPPAAVIRAWAGLGYNGRAVRLRRAAEATVRYHGGGVPDELSALEGLPGVGPYTARAVAAIAFGRPVAAVDTNVGRVVGRMHGLRGSIGAAEPVPLASGPPSSHTVIQALADGMVHPSRSADWTHAMMDVGASICRPREPLCGECPLRRFCRSAGRWRSGAQGGAGPHSAMTHVPFPATRRWLRGQIVTCLRAEPDGRWVSFEEAIGGHSAAAVDTTLRQLAAEGLIERDRRGRARLPLAAASRARA